MRCSAFRRSPVALLAIALSLQACYTWRPATAPPRAVVESEQPSKIRVTSNSGRVRLMSDPVVVNDSLVSPDSQCQPRSCRHGSGVPLREIRSLELREVSTPRTGLTLLVAGVLVARIVQALVEPDPVYECREGGVLGRVCGYYRR
jgi:hypothetical protein